jgi:hypothetical protein
VQSLTPEEVFELSVNFWLVETPVLIREIIADLRLDPSPGRIPRDVVRVLSQKMATAHGVRPVHFWKAAVANLLLQYVPMIGQVPVDGSASNVYTSRDGQGTLYDSAPEQAMWDRWAAGNFTVDDEQTATAWREGVKQLKLETIRDQWRGFARDEFRSAKNLSELISKIEQLFSSFEASIQRQILVTSLGFLNAPSETAAFVVTLARAGLIPRLKDVAPYSAYIAKLCFIFVAGLGRGFIGPRPSHLVDLQYLFYAPFCMVFISSDKFHRDMWPAVEGNNAFLWGPQVKADLARRVAARAERKASGSEQPLGDFNDSIDESWRRFMQKTPTSRKRTEMSKEEEQKLLEEIRERMKQFDEQREERERSL